MNSNPTSLFVGSRQLEVKDEANDLSYPVLVQYPTYTPSKSINFGPYAMDVSPDAPIANGQFPLVIISHGNSGSHLIYRTISTHLARNGFVVAMLEHFGNNRRNNELGQSVKNLEYRPRHISLTIDNLVANTDLGQGIMQDKIAVVGHSFGGYTALALAGGKPWTQAGEQVEVQNDSRVKAVVLMAPAAGYFMPDNSLDQVTIPIFLLIAEHDPYTPQKWTADVILNGVPDKSKITLQEVKNAGHFSFISPFPPNMKRAGFLPSTDPEGFDREAFHRQLPKDVFNFLNEKLN